MSYSEKQSGAKAVADAFLTNVWKLHGLPDSIVSDRGSQFISNFWTYLCARLRVKYNLSTARHPQTDGQTERVNSVVEAYLHAFVNYSQNTWTDWLPQAEFVGNNTRNASIDATPFFAAYGFNPRLGLEPAPLATE